MVVSAHREWGWSWSPSLKPTKAALLLQVLVKSRDWTKNTQKRIHFAFGTVSKLLVPVLWAPIMSLFGLCLCCVLGSLRRVVLRVLHVKSCQQLQMGEDPELCCLGSAGHPSWVLQGCEWPVLLHPAWAVSEQSG